MRLWGFMRLDHRIVSALIASGVIHASLAWGLWWTSRGEHPSSEDRTKARQPIRVGIDRSFARTLTWLGFERPMPHEAPQASVEQALFELAVPIAAGGGEPARGVGSAHTRSEAEAETLDPPIALAEAGLSRYAAARPDLTVPHTIEVTLPAGRESSSSHRRETQSSQEGAGEGNVSASGGDRQSPASSRVRPVRVRPGRPVAMQGLTIRTRVPPEFSIPTSLLAAGRRPVYAVSFAADGTVKMVRVVRSSGDPNVDEPGRNALYAWTAEGEALQDLPRGEALDGMPPDDPRRFVTVYIELVGA